MAIAPFLTLTVITDGLGLIIICYIAYKLVKADEGFVKENMLLYYEAMKRDKVFRKSLGIMGLAVLFSLTATILRYQEGIEPIIINAVQSGSSVMRLLFFVYLLKAVNK